MQAEAASGGLWVRHQGPEGLYGLGQGGWPVLGLSAVTAVADNLEATGAPEPHEQPAVCFAIRLLDAEGTVACVWYALAEMRVVSALVAQALRELEQVVSDATMDEETAQ